MYKYKVYLQVTVQFYFLPHYLISADVYHSNLVSLEGVDVIQHQYGSLDLLKGQIHA